MSLCTEHGTLDMLPAKGRLLGQKKVKFIVLKSTYGLAFSHSTQVQTLACLRFHFPAITHITLICLSQFSDAEM